MITSIFTACFTYKISTSARDISKKQQETMGNQFNFEIITSCTTRFQEILELIDSPDEKQKIRGYKKYIDLCNEELFYFQQGYIPDDVVKEWLDGMLNYIPIYYKDKKINLNKKLLSTNILEENNLLDRYPRIGNIFKVNKIYNRDNDDDMRKEIINDLLENIIRNL